MSVSYGGDSITFGDGSIVSSGSQGFKNKIINGAMMIDQRYAGAAVSTGTNFYTLDRWNIIAQTSAKITVQQMNSANSAVSNYESSSAPTGYINSLKVSVGASAGVTIGATDQYIIRQLIEGYNVADLDWGLSTAKTVTLSFWVKSSVIGTFGGALASNGGVAYPFTYSILSPNTWEQKSITITGSTTGTWLKDNQNGINVSFSLGVGATYSGTSGSWANTYYANATGSVKLVETNSATFYITGVQLEKGTTASSFEFRSIQKELMLCQRYYEYGIASGSGYGQVTSYFDAGSVSNIGYKVTKRVSPTVSALSLAVGAYRNPSSFVLPFYEGGYSRGFRYGNEQGISFWNVTTGAGGSTGAVGHLVAWQAESEI